MKKRLVTLLISGCMSIIVYILMPAFISNAATPICDIYEGSNVNAQNYSRCATPIESYLHKTDNGELMRIQTDTNRDGILIEYYDEQFNVINSRMIPKELPIWGGFYESDSNYFIVSGQTNYNESPDVEVFRITKYDKDWNRLDSAGLYDCNTTVPFDAGSLRMEQSGKFLLIRTAHEMYASSDGLNHQANVTIQLDMESMTITDSYTIVMNSGYGYVSHSFNQFIKVEDNHIVAVDHGDAYPRSIALLKYQTDISTGSFTPEYGKTCIVIDVLEFPGEIGDNYTGASVGGFELSTSSYLVAGNSVDQENSNSSTRNVFVASVDKETYEVKLNWITNYAEGKTSTTTPQFLKISDEEFLLLWSRENQIYYCKIDASGNKMTDVYSMKGALSDCVPCVLDGEVIWYTWDDGKVTFYEISLETLPTTNVTEIVNGHDFVYKSTKKNVATFKCSRCKETKKADVIKDFWVEEREYISEYSWYYYLMGNRQMNVNNSMDIAVTDFVIASNNAEQDRQIQITSSNKAVIKVVMDTEHSDSYETRASLKAVGGGKATITIKPKYNPSVKKTYTIEVINPNKKLKKDYTKTVNNITYKVTKAGKDQKAEVRVMKLKDKTKKTVTIPAVVNIDGVRCKVVSIASKAFYNNKNITTVSIGTNVTTINSQAFYGCKKLNSLKIRTTKLKTVGKQAFTKAGSSNYKKLVVKVPNSKLKEYKKLLQNRGLSKKVTIKKL